MTEHEFSRFWKYVDSEGKFSTECWPWIGAKNEHGYGWFCVRNGHTGMAHRLMWEQSVGPIPEGLNVLHKCDNSNCVNPGHLYVGTQSTNLIDSVKRGRRKTVLSVENVIEIKKLLRDSPQLTHKEISKKFGVSRGLVSFISRGVAWGHVNISHNLSNPTQTPTTQG